MIEDRNDFDKLEHDTWQERRQRMDELVEYYIKLKDSFDEACIEFRKNPDAYAEYHALQYARQAVIEVLEILEINGEVEDLAFEKIREEL